MHNRKVGAHPERSKRVLVLRDKWYIGYVTDVDKLMGIHWYKIEGGGTFGLKEPPVWRNLPPENVRGR